MMRCLEHFVGRVRSKSSYPRDRVILGLTAHIPHVCRCAYGILIFIYVFILLHTEPLIIYQLYLMSNLLGDFVFRTINQFTMADHLQVLVQEHT